MKVLFKVSTRVSRPKEDGTAAKAKKENFLFNSVSFTDAEASMTEYLETLRKAGSIVSKINPITAIATVEYRDIFMNDECEEVNFFAAKVSHEIFDIDSGNTTKATQKYLVQGDNWDHANEFLKLILTEFEGVSTISSLVATDIEDIIIKPVNEEEE